MIWNTKETPQDRNEVDVTIFEKHKCDCQMSVTLTVIPGKEYIVMTNTRLLLLKTAWHTQHQSIQIDD